jgi:hypothetical protein
MIDAKQWCDAIRDTSLTPDLSPAERHVLQNLGHYFKAYGRAHPGATKQASETGFHPKSIRDINTRLVTKRYLVVIEHGGSKRGGKRIANHYLPSLPDHVVSAMTHRAGDRVPRGPVS